MTTYALEQLIDLLNDVGVNREADHHMEDRMADIRRQTGNLPPPAPWARTIGS